ncbi:MAG: hypothetical protein ACK559_33680, partial [bacterium]
VRRRAVIGHDRGRFSIPMHADLFDGNFRGLVRGIQNIVVGGVDPLGKLVGGEMSAEMVGPSGGDMNGAENLLVLDVTPAEGQELGAEAEFAQFAGDRIALQFGDVFLQGLSVAGEEGAADLASSPDVEHGESAILKLHGHLPRGVSGDEVD